MFVDEGVEGHPVSPAGAEVVDVDVWIPGQKEETHSFRGFKPRQQLCTLNILNILPL